MLGRTKSWLALAVATVLAFGGCMSEQAGQRSAPSTPAPAPVPTPGRNLVTWVDGVCLAIQPPPDAWWPPWDSLPAETQDIGLRTYLLMESHEVAIRSLELKTLPRSGIRGGDELVAAYIHALKALQPELSRLTQGVDSLSIKVKRERLQQVRQLLAAIRPAGPDLAALKAGDPVLARAYELAPECDPATPPPNPPGPISDEPLPPAADGSNVGACLDGSCEIIVTGPADIRVRTSRVSVTEVAADRVNFDTESPGGGHTSALSPAGGFWILDDNIGIRIAAVSGGAALLRISVDE